MKSKSNRVFQNNVRKNISDNHMLQKDYAKSIGITTRLRHQKSAPRRHAYPQNFYKFNYTIRGGACDGAFIN